MNNFNFIGHDCSQRTDSELGVWEIVTPKSTLPKGSASSSAIVHNDSLWIIGGTTFNPDLKKSLLYRYDFKREYSDLTHYIYYSNDNPIMFALHICRKLLGKSTS